MFRSNHYDLLLLDVTLPDGTGFDVCKEVRSSSTIPIIFLTASDQEISIVKGLDMGGDDYITKPFKLNELLSRIKEKHFFGALCNFQKQRQSWRQMVFV